MNCEDLKLSQTQEIWVPITDKVVPNIKPYYYVSNWGRVGSMSSGTFKLLVLTKDKDGYLYAHLSLYPSIIDNTKIRVNISKRVNRLVIMSFYPIPENYKELEVNHINNIRNDNHLWNLEWLTSKENTSHALKYGDFNPIKGEKHPYSKLTEDDVYKIVELAKTGRYTYTDLGKIFNVTHGTIRFILNRKSWKHLNLNITEDDLECFRNTAFSDIEFDSICNFFESNDINNKSIYANHNEVIKDCFYSLGLDKKYNFESKRDTMIKILEKGYKYQGKIDKYNYEFIR